MSLLDKAKEHPYETAGIGVVAFFALYLLFFSGSSSGTATAGTTTTDPNYATDVAAATSLQSQQMGIAAQTSQYQTALQAQQESDAAALAGANINAATTQQANNLTAAVDLAQINAGSNVSLADIAAQQEVQDTANTLTAQTAQATNYNSLMANEFDAQQTTNIAQISSNALVYQAQTQAAVEQSLVVANSNTTSQYISTLGTIAAGQTAGQTAVGMQNAQNNAPRSLLQSIFG
jgi:hypothetical protein